MYLEHFGFREYPFSLTPDTDYFYDSHSHGDVLNVLQVALRQGEGFIAVSAEVGLGKTLLCRLLLRKLGKDYVTAYVPDPQLSPRTLRIALAEELGMLLGARWTDDQLMRRLQRFLINVAGEGRRVVLLLDEAHQLPPETLEAVRLLTNLETEKFKLLQVVMFGQPELDRRLAEPGLRQLRQRIGYRCQLSPLDRDTTGVYIAHRLAVAGGRADDLFSAGAVNAVYRASGGAPRLINMLCNKSLMAAFGRGDHQVTARHARRAIADTAHSVEADSPLARVSRWVTRPFARNGRAA